VKLLVVQIGNYAEAEHRFACGGDENYYGQRYTVAYVAGLVRAGHQIRVIALGEDARLERLPSGVESVGLRLFGSRFRRPRTRELIGMADSWQPTHLLLQVPSAGILRWGNAHGVEMLPMLFDSFRARGVRPRFRYRRLAAALNDPAIRWVGNHGSDAAADLVRIGADRRKVLPFDPPSFVSPSNSPPKRAPADPGRVRLTYVGQVTVAKGIRESIEAVGLAKLDGEHYSATITGTGELSTFKQQAEKLGIEDRIDFTGRVSHGRVLEMMKEGDVVVVPSRHEYPEGIPFTVYEGPASRSPVVVSDHHMFRSRIAHRKNGMVFRASSPESLHQTIHELVWDSQCTNASRLMPTKSAATF
jgi:glycosyltransferase involved in cell wall biosynthesis